MNSYLIVKVKIIIYPSKSFSFSFDSFSLTYILKLLKFRALIKININNILQDKEIFCVKLKDILILALFKFPNKNIKDSFLIIYGIIKSMNLFIEK